MGKNKIGKFIFPNGTQTEQIEQALTMLGLDACAASFQVLAERIQTDHRTFYDYLQAMLETEFAKKEDNRVSRWIQQAKIAEPPLSLRDYDFSEQPSLDQRQINELASCRFVEQGKNIIFLGAPGVGKTHLSCALALEAIEKGYETRFMRLNDFIIEAEKLSDAGVPRLQRALTAPKLLIMDDIDYYKTSEEAAAFLFEVVKQRYIDKHSTIITSNKNPKDWTLFGDRTGAAIDRLFDQRRTVIINITGGKSHRVPSPPQLAMATEQPLLSEAQQHVSSFTKLKQVFK